MSLTEEIDQRFVQPLIERLQLLEGRIMEQEERIRRLEASGNDPLPADAPDECKQAKCSYYTHYQVHYSREKQGEKLTHIAYHEAERRCEQVQKKMDDWMNAHPDKQFPEHLDKQCRFWETKVCA